MIIYSWNHKPFLSLPDVKLDQTSHFLGQLESPNVFLCAKFHNEKKNLEEIYLLKSSKSEVYIHFLTHCTRSSWQNKCNSEQPLSKWQSGQ